MTQGALNKEKSKVDINALKTAAAKTETVSVGLFVDLLQCSFAVSFQYI